MACEIPNIITDYTTTAEILGYDFEHANKKEIKHGRAGLGVPIACEIPGTWDVYRGFVNVDRFVEAMEILYNNKELREKMGKAGRERVMEEYSWGDVANRWVEKFKEVSK